MDDKRRFMKQKNLLCKNLPSDDKDFLDFLEEILSKFFNLSFSDIPKVLKLMGIEEPPYGIYAKEKSNSTISMYVYTKSKEFVLEIHRGEMISPYPSWDIVNKDYVECYFVGQGPKVERICSYDSDGNLQFY